jgi:hypothetical protein
MKAIYDWKEGDKNVGVICDWFNLDHTRQRISGQLIEQAMFSHGLHPFEYYVCSLPSARFSVTQNKSDVEETGAMWDMGLHGTSQLEHVPVILLK